MKKVLSIIISICVLLSITAGLNLQAYANDFETAYALQEGSNTCLTGRSEYVYDSQMGGYYKNTYSYYKFTAPKTGLYSFAISHSYCTVNIYDSNYNMLQSYYDTYNYSPSVFSKELKVGELIYFYSPTTVGGSMMGATSYSYSVEIESFIGIQSGSCGKDVTYTADLDNGVLTIDGVGRTDNYYGSGYFYNKAWKDMIKKVIINGEVYITYNFFCNLTNLETVVINNTGAIFSGAFLYDYNIKDIYLTNTANIYSDSLSGLNYGITLHFNNKVTHSTLLEVLESDLFSNIDIGNSTKYVFEDDILYNKEKTEILYVADKDITNLYIESTVDEINTRLYGLNNLKKIIVDSDNKSFKSIDGVLFDYYTTKLIKFPSAKALNEYDIPDGTRSISSYAFSDVSNLEKVNIPSSVVKIYYNAIDKKIQKGTAIGSFAHCYYLGEINDVAFDEYTAVKENEEYSVTFDDCADGKRIVYAFTPSTSDYYFFDQYYYNLEGVKEEANNSVYLFDSNGKLINTRDDVYLEAGKTYYYSVKFRKDNYSFKITKEPVSTKRVYKNGLYYLIDRETKTASVEGPSSDFYRYSILASIKGYPVTSINDYAFNGCFTVTQIDIPSSIKKIGSAVFANCEHLKAVNIEGNNFKFVDGVLYTADMKEIIWYPNSLASVDDFSIPAGVEKIGAGAFFENQNIKSITIPNTVTSIGKDAFTYSSIKGINIPSSVKTIGKGAFSGSSLIKISFEEGIEYISPYAFESCRLKEMEIPASVKEIGEYAFEYCNNLKSVIFKSDEVLFGANAFFNCNNAVFIATADSTAREYAESNLIDFIDVDFEAEVSSCNHKNTTDMEIPATCVANGAKITFCSDCGAYIDNTVLNAAGHDYDEVKVEATCKLIGYTTYTCKICGDKFTADFMPIANHTYVEEVVINPTCTNKGFTIYNCSTCQNSTFIGNYKDPVEPSYFLYDSIEATCANQGEEIYYCSDCYEYKYSLFTDKVDHVFIDYKSNNDAKPATCTTPGCEASQTAKCENCDETDTKVGKEIQALGHNFGNNNPTCITCGATNSGNTQPATTPNTESQQQSAPVEPTTAPVLVTQTPDSATVPTPAPAKPKATTANKLTAGKKQATVTVKKVSSVTGYEIQYSTDKKFKKNVKKIRLKGAKTTKKTIKGLKSKKTYYVRVRTYKTANGKTSYSSWSKVKTVKVK